MQKKTQKKNTKRKITRSRAPKVRKVQHILTMGNLGERKAQLLLVILTFIFLETFLLVPKFFAKSETEADYSRVSVTAETKRNTELEQEIKKMVKGYPIEEMAPMIASRDRQTAAFLVAIAKKESAWGKRRPVLNGENCYNYWGFRLKSESMGSGGHTCFDNPKQAVDVVADRIEELVKDYDRNTPSKMIVWKCGLSCASHDPESVKKWITDVDYYYKQVIN